MSDSGRRLAITGLHWVVGVVVLVASLRLALARDEGSFFAANPFLHHLRPILAWSEAVAAAVFLVPFTTILGGWLLLVIFAFAILIHILHGKLNIDSLLVYAAAVIVVMTQRGEKS
jgi:hypothetical protein